MLPPPLKYRRSIPFYYDKSETEFRHDPYENYATMVTRQLRLHLTTTPYPFQMVNDFIIKNLPKNALDSIVDLGCSVGQLIGTIAQQFPSTNCYGVDYSYQLLKAAHDHFIQEKYTEINETTRGFPPTQIAGKSLTNLQFLLAKAEQLPFTNHSLSAICSNFSLDRFSDPLAALNEMFRTLKVGGHAIICSPLNFQKTAHWETFYPPKQLLSVLEKIGFTILTTHTNLVVTEPLDQHGNMIHWRVFGVVVQKS